MKALFCMMVLGSLLATSAQAQELLYRSEAFVLTDTSVVQGSFNAVAVSPTEITSNYQRPRKTVNFKFSINGHDNEFPSGTDHGVSLVPAGGRMETPVYTFGEVEAAETPQPSTVQDLGEGAFDVTFRVDMRPVLESFEQKGYYEAPSGERIAEDAFEAVYIAGNEEPLTWDFEALEPGSAFELTDPDGDGIYAVTLPFEADYARPLNEEGRAVWTLQEAIAHFPQLASPQLLVEALYNLSLEEFEQDIREDGAFRAGAKWPGVWTRDISYSIVLALALVDPDGSKRSLMAKVDDEGRIIQDTGTGGSWPVSTDRTTWALAAWEIYLTTGDEAWLRQAYDIIARSAEADLQTAFDSSTGLFYGESSFLDWREQSYPDWMDPKDIYLSQALGTNAVHHATYQILARMAERLGEPAGPWREMAQTVKEGINTYLWQVDKGYYGQFRYGRNYLVLSPRAEALGEALTILYGVASSEQQQALAMNNPVVPFGVPSIYPYIPDIPPYHNRGIWPFVVAYWTWASAEAGNAAAVEHGLASIYRAAALFLTNKENMVASTGHFEGTEINSDRQLWSVAGNLATVYRILFGMRYEPDRLVFRPFIPAAYAGTRTLTNLPYRNAVLEVTIDGYGNQVARATLDGEPIEEAAVPGDLTGEHRLTITMNNALSPSEHNVAENEFSAAAPQVTRDGQTLQWEAVDGAVSYQVYRNGERAAVTTERRAALQDEATLAEYQVRAVDANGIPSFLSEPVRVAPERVVTIVPAARSGASVETEHDGFEGEGYLELTQAQHTTVELPVEIEQAGVYSVDVRYANGSGPINTNNKAAIRTLRVDGQRVGALVMPQRGDNVWTDWGYSNPLRVRLEPGRHTLTLAFTPSDQNMNREVNQALLDHVRLTLLRADAPAKARDPDGTAAGQ